MEQKKFRCGHCRKAFPVRVAGQTHCTKNACQNARKNAWRREKYASDLDYRLNQKDSTKAWLLSVGGAAKYYREYRRRPHPPPKHSEAGSPPELEKTQGESLFVETASGLSTGANSDALSREYPIKTGRYRIYPERANSDAIWAEIRVISDG